MTHLPAIWKQIFTLHDKCDRAIYNLDQYENEIPHARSKISLWLLKFSRTIQRFWKKQSIRCKDAEENRVNIYTTNMFDLEVNARRQFHRTNPIFLTYFIE